MTGLDLTGLDWAGLDWAGLGWTGLDCVSAWACNNVSVSLVKYSVE